MVHASGHVDIAAYILGALDEPDNAAFEEHLLDCPRCQLDLVELQDVPDLLDKVKHDAPALLVPVPGPQVLSSLLEEATKSRHQRRRRQWFAAAAAAVLIVAAPLVTILLTSDESPEPIASPPVNVRIETPPTTSDAQVLNGVGGEMDANVTMLSQDWGTQISIELRGAVGPRKCELVAVSTRGETETVTNWIVPPGGRNEPLKLTGGTTFQPADVARIEVRDDKGQVLLSVQG
ncbi:anti-sigma factor [Kibdelosporangium persicum]|uniref:Zf-HC2 domain-containing protein n=1 Tax=Kibdelosporangium persicum TaxID=2698649 RepID=A0ABX2F3Z4_9PSEU|nr:zf-HC2 domain-containing protein [Kibdelosporangium persicum]NRN66064.1 zf-HC2 domain-containing protein [Kibdelosporangium persicum]